MKRDGAALRVRRFLGTAAMGLFLCMISVLALCALKVNVHIGVESVNVEWVSFLPERALPNLVLTAVGLLALAALNGLLARFAGVRLCGAMLGLWTAAALFWVLGVGMVPETDPGTMVEAARLFAGGNYSALSWGYFDAYPYQLGFVLLMEGILRAFPGADVSLAVQCANVVCGVLTAGMMAALCELIFEDRAAKYAAMLLIVLFLPFLLFCTYVYGTLLMILLCSCAFVCFARYLRTRRLCFAVAMMLALALGYAVKLNALIPMLALCICAALDAMESRDARALLCAASSILLGVALSRLVVAQYEWRSGIRVNANVCRLTWLMMGLGEPASMPGWFNGYVVSFIGRDLTAQEQKAIVLSDLQARIPELLEDPLYTVRFLRDKILSQWMEPTYSTIWWGTRCDWSGRFNGLAAMLYREGEPLRLAAEAYMNVYQQCLYALSAVGAVSALRRMDYAAALVLPVTLLGGLLFHALFEAKSQYIYLYAVFMMPLAARGLCCLTRALGRLAGRRMKEEL